jgi:protein-disulfide isomerase
MYSKKSFIVLVALSVSLMIISVSFFVAKNRKEKIEKQEEVEEVADTVLLDNIPGVEEDDHILGNPDAPIVFIVYFDFACPFCKKYHKTLNLLMDTYGKDGSVAIILRQMPFVQLHPEAPMYAQASECVAKISGNAAFWKFADKLFEEVDTLKPFSASEIVDLASSVGISKQEFVSCMRSDELMKKVESDFKDAMNAKAKGAPFTVVLSNGEKGSFEGAQKFRTLAFAVQSALRSMKIKEVKGPSDNDFSKQFENIDINSASSSTSSSTVSDTATTSILDGIIN